MNCNKKGCESPIYRQSLCLKHHNQLLDEWEKERQELREIERSYARTVQAKTMVRRVFRKA